MTTLSLPSMNTPSGAQQRDFSASEFTPQGSGPVVNSTDLLKGGKSIGIEHKGAFYRLQETKLGKLILTK